MTPTDTHDGLEWKGWALLVLAAVNGISGLDGHRPEHYVAGAVFFGAYCILGEMRRQALGPG